MTPGKSLFLPVVLILAALPQPAFAQEPLPFEGAASQRIEQYKKIQLMDFLKLDEETSIRFFARYNRFVDELNSLNKRKNSFIDELQVLVRRNASEAEFQRVFRRIDALGDETLALRREYFDELSQLLPAQKVAAYIVFERNFYRNLRELLREAQRDRSGRAPR
jgi:hypothetical protein